MTSPADLSHAVLLRVAEFIRTLPADQLADLAAGRVRLQLSTEPAAGGTISTAPDRATRARSTATRKAATATTAPVSAEKVRADLVAIGDRVAAGRYLDDLGLKVAELRALARDLGITVPSRATKPAVVQEIVQWTVGRRLSSEAISRPAPAAG